MAWHRLDAAKTADHLVAEFDPGGPEDQSMADEALLHLRERLREGAYVVIQSHSGRTFIGTPAEAAAFMLEAGDE